MRLSFCSSSAPSQTNPLSPVFTLCAEKLAGSQDLHRSLGVWMIAQSLGVADSFPVFGKFLECIYQSPLSERMKPLLNVVQQEKLKIRWTIEHGEQPIRQ